MEYISMIILQHRLITKDREKGRETIFKLHLGYVSYNTSSKLDALIEYIKALYLS